MQKCQLAIIPPIAWALARSLYLSNRVEVRDGHYFTDAIDQGRALLGVWHESAIMAANFHRGNNFHSLTSYSFDGELAARLISWFNEEAVRGSSSKGGSGGLRQLEKALQLTPCVGLTMDGPRGPRREAKPGLAILSARAGVSVIPNAFVPTSCWRMRSWDRFPVPKPGGRVICAFGAPIPPPENDSREAINAMRLKIETALNTLYDEIEAEIAQEGREK
jgi:lysophospholipid acyltransferase (LPLAT)-like uncharacterized protein